MLNGMANILLALFVACLLVAFGWWLSQRPMFTLKLIRVEGVEKMELRHVNVLTVRGSAIPRIRGNFLTTNLDAVRLAFESVPWVRKASVRREWPNKLIVTIEEHQAVGTWGDDGRLLSAKGDVFTANMAEAEEDGALPEFFGPDGSEKEVIERFLQMRQWLSAINLAPESVQLSRRYAWTVKLNNGMSVELGREQDSGTLKSRVDRLIEIYPQLVARLQDRIESVDMRYPNGMALRVNGLAFGSIVKEQSAKNNQQNIVNKSNQKPAG